MTMTERELDWPAMAAPLPLDEVASQIGVSRRTMWKLIRSLGLTRHRMPGGGKTTYIDPEELRRKRQPKPVQSKTDG